MTTTVIDYANPYVKGQIVKWMDDKDTPHYGMVTEVFRDTVEVTYGSGNAVRKKRFLASQVDEANLRQQVRYTPRELHATALRLSTKPGYEWAAILVKGSTGASTGSPAASSTAPIIKRPKNLPDDTLVNKAEDFIRHNPNCSRAQIMDHLGMTDADVPAYMAIIATLMDEKRITKTGAKRGTRYHPAVVKA